MKPAKVTVKETTEAAFIREMGCFVTTIEVMDLPSGLDAAQLPPDMLIRRATAMALDRAEALLIPDTALHTLDSIDAIEREIRKPVLTANQVTLWHAFCRAGCLNGAPAFGRLFSTVSR